MPSERLVGDRIATILEEQATWLEAEIGSAPEPVRAKIFLALSEIRAILGDRAQAHGFAIEARDLAPSMVLAHHQARALDRDLAGSDRIRPHSAVAEAAALVAEATSASLPAAKHHATLLAAEALRLAGDQEGAVEQISRVAEAGDIRGVVGRAALGLAQSDLTPLCTFVVTPEAKPVAAGLTATLRLHGMSVGSAGAPTTAEDVCDTLRAARQALEAGDTVAAASRIAEARAVPELASGATWLAASLAGAKDTGRAQAMTWLTELAKAGDSRAGRVLAARAVEADDIEGACAALALGGFSLADRGRAVRALRSRYRARSRQPARRDGRVARGGDGSGPRQGATRRGRTGSAYRGTRGVGRRIRRVARRRTDGPLARSRYEARPARDGYGRAPGRVTRDRLGARPRARPA